ncbi:MAG TPA: tryptophan synthase subunit alpha [Clostridiales bacterium]|jgi:tryptophan synthase alpha chain|nr:tryptophan synthase subunit alpha [Clostridiales bacterium]
MIKENNNLFVGYLLLGYPGSMEFLNLLKELNDTPLDILELGIPSKSPEFDGIVIQEAHKKVDHDLLDDMNYFKKVRNEWSKPIWIMGYYNDLISSDLYLRLAKNQVYDALVIPDMPLKEYEKHSNILTEYNIELVAFINPEMDASLMNYILKQSKLVYGQLYKGKTGSPNNNDDYKIMLNETVKHPDVKVFAGFGIKTKEQADKLWSAGFNGCIIGTEMIRKLNKSEEALIDYIYEIKG